MLQTLLTLGALSAIIATPAPRPNPSDGARAVANTRAHQERRQAQERRRDARRDRSVHVDGERTVQSFRIGDAGNLHISNLSGDVIISGGASGGEIRVEAIKRGRGPNEREARQQLGTVDIDVRKVGSRVEIETTHGRNSRAWVDYTIRVPSRTTIDIRTVSGDIKVTDVQGEVRAESVSGDIVAASLARVALLKSVSGDVDASAVASEGDLILSSVSGDVVAKGLKSRGATVDTVSGDVDLSGCTCSRASVQSTSGDVAYSGKLEKSGRYEFKTHSGDVVLASSDGFELEASTFSGSLRNDLALTARSGDLNFDSRRRPGRTVRGAVGNGGAFVEIKTFSGDIVLTRAR